MNDLSSFMYGAPAFIARFAGEPFVTTAPSAVTESMPSLFMRKLAAMLSLPKSVFL